jgi:hypothetical protein
MKTLKMMILSGMAIVVLALAGCSDRSYDTDAQRSFQESQELRDRIKYTQVDR